MNRRGVAAVAVGLALLGGAGGAAMSRAGLIGPGLVGKTASAWQEVAWPFPRDAWPSGRAFRCHSTVCGGDVEVAIRPKLGFCNCATGVSGDSEVDAVSDVDMISEDFAPQHSGTPVTIATMAGRTRVYTLRMPDGSSRPAAGLAISAKCDVVVAASQGDAAGSDGAQAAIASLIASPPMTAWLRSLLGKG